MKKSLAILILCFLMLCGSVHAAMPVSVVQSTAGVSVEVADSTYYFETLTPELFLWLSEENTADSRITLLSDLTLSSKEGTNFLSLGQTAGKVPAIQLNMNGHTITYTGPSNLFAIPYDGDLTVKNGTILYECTDNTRSPFLLGATSSQQCDPKDASVPVRPRLTLQQLQVHSRNPGTGRVINCFQWMADILVEDSFLWTDAAKSAAIDMRKSTQKDSDAVQWKGPYTAKVTMMRSTIGTAGNYALASTDQCSFTAEETTLVSAVAAKDPTTPGTVTGSGKMTAGKWKGTLPDGKEVLGVGTFWTAPNDEESFKEDTIPEWFPPYTGVNIFVLVIPAVLAAGTLLMIFKKQQ